MNRVERIVERFLSTEPGRQVAQTLAAEDRAARRALVATIAETRRDRARTLDTLDAKRRPLAETVQHAREALTRAQDALAGVDREIRAVTLDAERRIALAEGELRRTAPEEIARASLDLLTVADQFRVGVWSMERTDDPGEWHRRTVTITNAPTITAVVAALHVGCQRLEALTVEAVDDVEAAIARVRDDVEAVAAEHGVSITWPVRA